MLRRSHKKSRDGCLPCKQRHVKCDEGRPVCMLCTMSGRRCSYAFSNPPIKPIPPSLDSPEPQATKLNDSILRRDHHEQENIPSSALRLNSALDHGSAQHRIILSQSNQDRTAPEHGRSNDINIDHMELLLHLTLDNDIICLSLGDEAFTNPSSLSHALKLGLKSPYLLHELLAISSLHLASLNPKRTDFYLHQAISLQSRAISLFNLEWKDVTESSCVAVLLFSSILGHHLLAETLATRDPGGLDTFMANYVHCIEIHRGIHTIAMTFWPQLMESELEPLLSSSSRFTSRSPRGQDCQGIGKMVDCAQELSKEDKEACHLMIRHLQVGIDAATTELERGYRHYMIYTWLMLAPRQFIDLLSKKRPEALILLAYYAVLLHYGRNLWQVGDAGVHILSMICDYLQPQWHIWLQYPQQMVLKNRQ